MASGDLITRIASEDTSQNILDVVSRMENALVDPSKIDWKSYFAARATGEVFSTKFYTYETSTNPAGVKMNASAGLRAVPSTETVKGADDFANHNAFSYVDCNFACNDAGKRIPTKIQGQNGFSRVGKVDVGILTPQTYWAIEEHYDDGYYIVHFSDKKHEELNMVSTPWCTDSSGNEMGYGIVTKYYAGMIDGILYSSSGIAPKGFVSYESGHTLLQNKGTGYYGSGSERTAYLMCMLWIKYATKNSQTVFRGHVDTGNYQYKVAEATTNCDYLILTTANANNLVVGGCVSIGDPGSNTNYDRQQSYMFNILDRVRVKRIEPISGTSNSKVYVTGGTFTTTATTMISTEPCYSGETDNILGADGYVANDGKHSFRLNGVEEGIGAWYISMNELWNKESATVVSYYVRGNATWSASSVSGYKKVATFDMGNTNDQWFGDLKMDVKTGVFHPRVYGSGDSVGVGDMHWKGGNGTGLREALQRGFLGHWSLAGLAFSALWGAVSLAGWLCALAV